MTHSVVRRRRYIKREVFKIIYLVHIEASQDGMDGDGRVIDGGRKGLKSDEDTKESDNQI